MMPSQCFSCPLSQLLLFLFFISSFFPVHSFHDDRQFLLAFKSLITSDPQRSMDDWSPSVAVCNWTGVTCSRRHPNRVTVLNLISMDLQGTVSPFLGNLSFLRLFDLSNNSLHGPIRPQLGRLFRLRVLTLRANSLTGTIPSSLGNLSMLIILAIGENNLTGVIPPQLGLLTSLQKLYLFNNALSGNIPSSLSNISSLTDLDISSNKLIGSIPQDLGLLTNLQLLYLYENNLIGSIPQELGLLRNLEMFILYENKLSGGIPISLSNISTLIRVDVSTNTLSGKIPPELGWGLLTSLQMLYLYENELSGSIPTCLSNISTLIYLQISTNKLTGNIPKELSLLRSLRRLYLYENELSGSIPTLSNISNLIELKIFTNKLTGNIPHGLGILTKLQVLFLFENELLGNIPPSLSNISSLTTLSLFGNQLSGNIPTSIGNCFNLKYLILSNNKLTRTVPVELGKLPLLEVINLHTNQLDSGKHINMSFFIALTNCSRLQKIHLANNKLSGVLPLAIGKLSTNMTFLSLSNNRIEGNIPPQISNLRMLTFLNLSGNLFNGTIPALQSTLRKLERLDLGNNRLEGNIPSDIKQLKHLGLLDISGNLLSGKIPNSLCHTQLRSLHLHHNYLSDKIPPSLGHCTNLALLDLSHNKLSGSIPLEVATLPHIQLYINLSWNLLDGHLPPGLGIIVNALAIDISANQLTGVIPATLGSCIALESLNLSNNSLDGSIPDSLGKLQNLMDLDLSSNSLSGSIPIALKNLQLLYYLNLSFNNLSGEISKEGFFANQTSVIYLFGNPGLCGPQVFSLPTCPTPRSHSHVLKKVVFPIVGAIGFILCCLLLGLLLRRNSHIKDLDLPRAIFQKLEHRWISYHELSRATNGFAEAYLLGKGSFGSVYKGVLSDGILVAVKVFNLQNDQGEKSFKVECNVLQKVRHRNLVKIITSCSNSHFKGLVFEFMSNGSLEKHLYPEKDDNNDEDVCGLGLKARLDIAIDVAHAMEYLHHDCFVQVVHCDIKPNNVLLDENMSCHVTDFGIARLIGATSTDSLTSTLSLKGSMGYIAPEYGLGESVSIQGDVYSYGILLLEMFTRKKPTSDMFVEDLNLHKWINLAFPNRIKEVIDNNLLNEVDEDEIKEGNIHNCLLCLLRVGLLCSKDSPEERPTMRDVSVVLESIKEDLVENAIASRKERRNISNLFAIRSATRVNSAPSNDQSPTF